ncbi:Unconventional myosin-XVIIIa [Saguinus oedipus]|uniref:Unconventional myosin-XVIIIa n=1 Tax=Saguinus oedipus TaxID=9490 RepID=A0ABQ9VQ23_SAGOE|nr:Unconventional myosin-XVIIIa [Saguinus oedipus]
MEVQLEEEYEDKQKVLREKRELEGKLATLSDQVRGRSTCQAWPAACPCSLMGGDPRDGELGTELPGEWGCSKEPIIIPHGMGASPYVGIPRPFSLVGLILALPYPYGDADNEDVVRRGLGKTGGGCVLVPRTPTADATQVNRRDFESEKRLRKDLKRTKALLADAQLMLDHLKNSAPSKREIAQLKNQLEESEFTCAAAVKARKAMEVEIEDLHLQIDDIAKAKTALEEQLSRLQREKNEIQNRLEEDQEDMNELMKKHKAAVAQASRDLAQINDLQAQLEEANKEKQELQEKLQALQSQVEFLEQSMVDKSLVSRQEAKIRELETRLEFERTQVKRLEAYLLCLSSPPAVQSLASRLKENMEKLTEERDQRIAAENREKEQNKRLQRQLRDTKEEMGELARKEAEASRKKHELEMDLESLEAANQSLQADLKLAFKRIGDLQAAIEDEMESDENEDLINSLQDMAPSPGQDGLVAAHRTR